MKVSSDEYSFLSKKDPLVRVPFNRFHSKNIETTSVNEFLKSNDIEDLLSESLSHRFQVSGDIVVKLTSVWNNSSAKFGSIIKIDQITPDELSPSAFVRFSLWNSGEKIGDYSLPIRVAHMRDIYVTSRSIPFGTKLSKNDFKLQKVDALKQHANSVPATTELSSFQLDSFLQSNTPLKWNHISKANLIRKGQVVDVFASGNGIYVTMKGLALEDGVKDSFVKVRNISSDKEFHAKVLNQNSVKVSL